VLIALHPRRQLDIMHCIATQIRKNVRFCNKLLRQRSFFVPASEAKGFSGVVRLVTPPFIEKFLKWMQQLS
jgi:hypothetical protein